MRANPIATQRYSPLYFLATLGAGGLVVTFFMWVLFWIPHQERPVPVFEDLLTALQSGDRLQQGAVLGAWAGIAVFSVLMLRLLAWNLTRYAAYRRTAAYEALRQSNAETQLLAIPLTLAMTVNVGFIVGLVFVPGLWTIVEYLFPFALLAFLAIGLGALKLLGNFWGRVLTSGGFDCSRNNSFGQLLPAFALAMVGVGLAAPAAMSTTAWVAGVSFFASSLFIVMAVLIGTVKLFLGVRAMMEHGADAESAPTLWIVVPIITVISIALLRQDHALHAHFGAHGDAAATFQRLIQLYAVQIAFALFGWVVLNRLGYFGRFVTGREASAGSYALVCPGVALAVMTHFVVNKGLVGVGLIEKFDIAYWVLTAVAVVLQAASIWLVLRLNAKHFSPAGTNDHQAVPAQ